MKRFIAVCCGLAFLTAGTTYARLPPPSEAEQAQAAAASAKAAEEAKEQAKALARAQDRAVANYKLNHMPKAPLSAVEKLACMSGTEDRHARIGVELVNGKVSYFAYYSKWKPRTCSIEVKRGDAYSRWEDHGAASDVILIEGKGVFLIDGKSGSYRFDFRNIDRGRYCGMDGKINGSLTVTRGKSSCVVKGVMDGHAG
jgi:hypothetical protein